MKSDNVRAVYGCFYYVQAVWVAYLSDVVTDTVRFADKTSLILEYLYRSLWRGRAEAKWFTEEERNTILSQCK